MILRQFPRWFWVAIALLTVLIAALIFAWAWGRLGWQRFDAAIEEAREAGVEFDRAAWCAKHPPPAKRIQDAAWSWSQVNGSLKPVYPGIGLKGATQTNVRTWVSRPIGDPPTDIEAFRQAWRPRLEEWRGLAAQAPWLSAGGWADPTIPFTVTTMSKVVNLLGMRGAVTALGIESWLADDPRPWLNDQRALVNAISKPGCLIDGMIFVAMDRIRDDTWLNGIAHRRWPRELADPWMHEIANHRSIVASSIEGEHALFTLAALGNIRDDPSTFGILTGRRSSGLPVALLGGWAWTTGGHSGVAVADATRAQIGNLQSTEPHPSFPMQATAWNPIMELLSSELGEVAIIARQAEITAQLNRVAGATLLHWRESGARPPLPAENDAPWLGLTIDPAVLHIRIEAVGDDGIQVAPVTGDPGRWITNLPADRRTGPPGQKSWSVITMTFTP